jgi:uncharacterized protein
MSSCIAAHIRGASIAIQVEPRASKTKIVAEIDGWLKVRVAAPPVDGAANQEIVTWLSKQLKVPKGHIEILSGERGRKKVILVSGMSAAEVRGGIGLT